MKTFRLYNGVLVNENTPIIPNGNFTWGEATKGLTRIPRTKAIQLNIISVAKEMQKIRAMFGNNPITVNSWYRDWKANVAAGSNKYSQHLKGKAVDFRIKNVSPSTVYRVLCKAYPNQGVGRYGGFTHFDNRGQRARW